MPNHLQATHLVTQHCCGTGRGNFSRAEPDRRDSGGEAEDEHLSHRAYDLSGHGDPEQAWPHAGALYPRAQGIQPGP